LQILGLQLIAMPTLVFQNRHFMHCLHRLEVTALQRSSVHQEYMAFPRLQWCRRVQASLLQFQCQPARITSERGSLLQCPALHIILLQLHKLAVQRLVSAEGLLASLEPHLQPVRKISVPLSRPSLQVHRMNFSQPSQQPLDQVAFLEPQVRPVKETSVPPSLLSFPVLHILFLQLHYQILDQAHSLEPHLQPVRKISVPPSPLSFPVLHILFLQLHYQILDRAHSLEPHL